MFFAIYNDGKKVFVLMNPYTVVECNLTRGLLLLCRYVCDLYKGTCENYIKDFLPSYEIY